MFGVFRMFTVPFTTAFTLAGSLWNSTGDWGWNVVFRIMAMVGMFGGVVLFFVWCFCGFQLPF